MNGSVECLGEVRQSHHIVDPLMIEPNVIIGCLGEVRQPHHIVDPLTIEPNLIIGLRM